MPLYEPIVPTRYTAPLLALVRSEHTDMLDQLLTAASIRDTEIADPDASLTMLQFDRLLSVISLRTGRDDLGFEIGSRVTLDLHGGLGVALRRCATVDAALRLAVRYHHLITPGFRTEYYRHPDRGEFVYLPAAYMSTETLHALQEIHATSFHMQFQAILGTRLRGYDIYVSMDEPRHASRYARLRPARFHFGHIALPEVRVVIAAALLEEPILLPPHMPPEPADFERSGRRERARRWSEWVIMMLREAEGCQPSLELLASLLNVSPRTLTRQLEREQQSFRELATRVRQERAYRLLADPQYPITQIAYRLGYADAANFSHAFRAASGVSPRQYRQAHHFRDATETGEKREFPAPPPILANGER